MFNWYIDKLQKLFFWGGMQADMESNGKSVTVDGEPGTTIEEENILLIFN